jgi:hypothetical protein
MVERAGAQPTLSCVVLLQEIRRHVELFNASGKMSIAYMERAGEKEYYLGTAFKVLLPAAAYSRLLLVFGCPCFMQSAASLLWATGGVRPCSAGAF